MTDLERARAHLQYEQESLSYARRLWHDSPEFTAQFEHAVLAALSWVWEEQQKAGLIVPGRIYAQGWQYLFDGAKCIAQEEQ